MEISASLLTPAVQRLALVLALAVFALAVLRAPWRALLAVAARQHVLFACVLALALLWSIAFRPVAGIELHLLGMTAVTLLFGWALASLAGAATLGLLLLAGRQAPDALPLAWLLGVVVPALTVTLLVHWLERSRVRNLFVFLLGVGFGGAMLTVLATALAGLAVLWAGGQQVLVGEALAQAAMLPLFLFPEGFINGAAVSTLTVYFPQVVRAFNEERFLGGP